MVLSEISADFENVDQMILPNVAEQCAKLGFAAGRSHIIEALGALVENGLAKAYVLSSKEPAKELQGMPPMNVPEEHFVTYFYITTVGMEYLRSENKMVDAQGASPLKPGPLPSSRARRRS